MTPLELKIDFDDIDVEEAAEPTAPALNELHRALNEPYSFTPAASAMAPVEIKAAISAGRDPLAEAKDQSPDKTNFLTRPPMPSMIMAARFAALLSSEETQRELTAPRSFTMLTIADNDEREAVWKEIDNVLRRLADLCDEADDTWRGFATLSRHVAPDGKFKTSEQETFDASIATAVRKGCKLLAFVPDTTSMSDVTRALCQRTVPLPALSGQMIIEIMRTTHSATGELSEDALIGILPNDSEIAALPLAAIESAFFEDTTLKVAKALAAAATRFRTVTPAATTLSDISLNEATRAPIDRLVADITSWKAGQVQWSEVSSSVLFHGPPGNGKTLLASALAGSLGVPLIATSYSDCQRHGHQGDMLKALSVKVNAAINAAPAVFFLDELDSFTHRNRPSRGSDYIVGIVNGLLEYLSRLNDTPGVVVLGATNFPDMIDPAVLRPGRFDLKLEIANPDMASVLKILNLALGNDAKDMSLSPIADQLLGASGAQVTAVVREARGLARADKIPLSQSHLEAAASRIYPALDANILWRIAVHEAGHLVVAHTLNLPPAERATITNTGGFVDIPSSMLESSQTATNRICALLGGRAAEQAIFGEALNGAGLGDHSDLELATKLAAQMAYEWGFGDQLVFTPTPAHIKDRTNHLDKILKDAERNAIQILTTRKDLISSIAVALCKERELSGEQIRRLLPTDGVPSDTV
ncbi:peptidase M41-like protein [Pacificibacter maritimus]|uniref:Peptidase M41-like protein n=1 Tax=Pacificibacter maritimus TaxID=762213 RepID=A0A3N4VGX4_9RHOB|nr:AAA family ATPase [Pacificibacter maritimus]RPE72194.1 peptidase M41-like protein [Pacificibacter maritimus]